MTVPVFTQEEFLSFLKNNGCTVVSTDHWDELDTILLEKDGETFSVFLEPKYFYFTVVLKCRSLGIEPPRDHLLSYLQHGHSDEPCYCKSNKAYKDCHRKVEQ